MLSRRKKVMSALAATMFASGVAFAAPASAATSFDCYGKNYTSDGTNFWVAGSGGKFVYRFGSNAGHVAVQVVVAEGEPAKLFLFDVGRGGSAGVGNEGTGYSLCLPLRDNTAGPEITVKRNGNTWRDFYPFP